MTEIKNEKYSGKMDDYDTIIKDEDLNLTEKDIEDVDIESAESIKKCQDDYMVNKSDIEDIDIDDQMTDKESNDEESQNSSISDEEELYDQPNQDKYGNIIWRIKDGSE